MFSCGFIGSAYASYDVNSNEIILDQTTVTGDIIGSGGSFSLTFNITNTKTISGVIRANNLTNVIKSGNGTLTLSGTNTYTVGTTISAGTLSISAPDGIGSGSAALTLAGGTLRTGGAFTLSRPVALTSSTNSTVDTQGYPITLSGVIGDSCNFIKSGVGTLTLSGVNTYTGATTISAGTLQIGAGSTTGSIISSSVVNNATLAFNRSNDITYSGMISGTGTVTKSGVGTLTLSGENTYAGPTFINAGTLQIGVGLTTGSIASSSVVNNATLAFNRSDAITYSGMINGAGAVTKSGAGTLILSGSNTYAGTTTISAGTLQIGAGSTTGSIISSSVVNNGILAFNRSNDITYTGMINGTGAVTKSGVGTLILSGSNTYAGTTTISAGTLNISAANGIGLGTATLTLSGGALQAGGGFYTQSCDCPYIVHK